MIDLLQTFILEFQVTAAAGIPISSIRPGITVSLQRSFTFEDFGSLQKSRLLMTKLNSKTGVKGILVFSLNRRTDIARSESGSRGI